MTQETMRAFVVKAGSAQLELRGVPVPGPDDVVVKTTLASFCSADVATVNGAFEAVGSGSGPADGLVVGHEAVGVVHAVGSRVEGFEPGQRVVAVSTTPCGRCENCQRGYRGHCGATLWGGYSAGVSRDGVLAEYFLVPDAQHNLAEIPAEVSDEVALLVTDTFSSGSTGLEAAELPLGGVAVVVGQGHIGLGATLAAKLRGAGLVIAVRSRPGGEELGASLGADRVFNTTTDDVRAEVLRLTAGQGADCVVEASGTHAGFALALALTRLGGAVSVLSSYSAEESAGGPTLALPLEHWGYGIGDKRILSTFQRCGSERATRLMRLLANSGRDLSPFFTDSFAFADIERAFVEYTTGGARRVKPLVRFHEPTKA